MGVGYPHSRTEGSCIGGTSLGAGKLDAGSKDHSRYPEGKYLNYLGSL